MRVSGWARGLVGGWAEGKAWLDPPDGSVPREGVLSVRR